MAAICSITVLPGLDDSADDLANAPAPPTPEQLQEVVSEGHQVPFRRDLRQSPETRTGGSVEGCARNTAVDSLRLLDTAYGSARELEYQLSLATRLGLLAGEASNRLVRICQETGKVLHGLIRSMRLSSSPRPQEIAAEGRSA